MTDISFYSQHNSRLNYDYQKDYTVIDIETTGLNALWDKVIQISAIKVRNHIITDKYNVYVLQKGISEFIAQLTGITNSYLKKQGIEEEKAITDFLKFIKNEFLVGQNMSFDLRFLNVLSYKYVNEFIKNNRSDTMYFERKVMHIVGAGENRLDNLAYTYDVSNVQQHNAFSDVYTTQQIYEKQHILFDSLTEKPTKDKPYIRPKEKNFFHDSKYESSIGLKPDFNFSKKIKGIKNLVNENKSKKIIYRLFNPLMHCEYIGVSRQTKFLINRIQNYYLRGWNARFPSIKCKNIIYITNHVSTMERILTSNLYSDSWVIEKVKDIPLCSKLKDNVARKTVSQTLQSFLIKNQNFILNDELPFFGEPSIENYIEYLKLVDSFKGKIGRFNDKIINNIELKMSAQEMNASIFENSIYTEHNYLCTNIYNNRDFEFKSWLKRYDSTLFKDLYSPIRESVLDDIINQQMAYQEMLLNKK